MKNNFVVAGGSSGIGLRLVNSLAERGNRVFVYSRSQGTLNTSDCIQHHCWDFTDDSTELPGLPDEIAGAAYCPGSINLRSFRSLRVDDFRADLEVNLVGAVKFLRACRAGLKNCNSVDTSSVVLFSSVAVGLGMPMHSSIASAKGAIEGLTRSLAAEWSPHTRVNCLAPALTDTPLASRFLEKPAQREAMAARYPLQRVGRPDDLASMAEFLLLPQSSWMSGQIIGVDGGMSALQS